MPDRIILLDMLAQFTGWRDGIDNSMANFGISAMCYAVLFALVRIRFKNTFQPREQIVELMRCQDSMRVREDRILKLKRDANDLNVRLGQPIRYPSQVIS